MDQPNACAWIHIKREYNQIPTRDEPTSEMAGTQFLSKLDAFK